MTNPVLTCTTCGKEVKEGNYCDKKGVLTCIGCVAELIPQAPPWKVLCDHCHQRYEQSGLSRPFVCGACGSDDILVGRGPSQGKG